MLTAENGPVRSKEDGDVCADGVKHDGKYAATKSNWTALPDLLLIFVPSGILLLSGTNDDKLYLVSLLVLVAAVSSLRSSNGHGLAVLNSLMYSAVFPFTVSVGGFSGDSWHLGPSAGIACMTVFISTFDLSMQTTCQLAALMTLPDDRWYPASLLYLTTFEAISKTAQTSFNFEEVSLISYAIIHIMIYISQAPTNEFLPHDIFSPGLTFGMLLAIVPAVPVLRKIRNSAETMKLAFISYAIVGLSMMLFIRPWLVATLQEDPVIWITFYMTSLPGYELRLAIVLWWIIVLAFGILVPVKFFTGSSDQQDDGESLNKRRKFFHGIVVLLFLPALNIDSYFTSIAMSLATSLFLLAEVIRHYAVPPLGNRLGDFFSIFTDERDTRGPLVVSHIFLLVGCAVPVWMSLYGSKPASNALPIEGFSGVLCLGCGDAMASIIGKKYGKRRWPRTKKTIEGTIAFALAVVVGAIGLAWILPRFPVFTVGGIQNIRWGKFIICTISTALLEAMSLQNDNLVIPVYMWILLRLWNVNGN